MSPAPAGSGLRVPIDLGSASSDSAEGRAFYQERLGIFGGWVFFLSFGFYIVNVATFAPTDARMIVLPSSWLHLTASLVSGSVWLITRRAMRAMRALRWLDAAGSITACGLFALMGAALARQGVDPISAEQAVSVATLACAHTIIFRAVSVPSTPGRTAWITLAALSPVLALSWYVGSLMHHGVTAMVTVHLIPTLAWIGVTSAVAVVASRIIFGLRAEADKVKRLGQYTLEEKIGEGGMGVVYRARHVMLRRPTAIKLLPPDRAGEENIRRFEREVQLTAELSHPSVVSIFDYGRTPDGVFYYAMEYLDGLTLEELVKQDGAQPPGRVIHMLQQVCGALAEAHGRGLIHRDIKPANIILTERGGMPDIAKVVDFGLVKHLDPHGTDATMAVTKANVLTGTPLYLSPEAIRGEHYVDARSDLYALGAVGYFLLTGRPVFEAATVVEVFAHHLHTEPVPPSERIATPIPNVLELAILRCLAKDPAQRPPDARTLQLLLARCPCVVPWTTEQASEWWEAYRSKRTSRRAPPAYAAPPAAETIAVDLADRVGTR
jgi:serine/threonine-protein kinase